MRHASRLGLGLCWCNLGGTPFKSVDHLADGNLVTRMEFGLFDSKSVNTQAVPTTKIADHDPFVSEGDAAMSSGDFGKIDPYVALGMPTDEHHGALESHDGCCASVDTQWDEAGRHTASPLGLGRAIAPTGAIEPSTPSLLWT